MSFHSVLAVKTPLALLLILPLGNAAAQNTIRVTSLANEGPGSLREAMVEALYDGQRSTIVFDVAGRIRIDRSLPPVADQAHPTIIDGRTAPGQVIIDGTTTMTQGSGMLVGSSNNLIIDLDFEGIEFDAFNMTSGATRNIVYDVNVRNTRRGGGFVLLGSDENIFAYCELYNNATVGCFARSGADRNQFGPGLVIRRNQRGGLLVASSIENRIISNPGMENVFQGNGLYAIGLISGSQRNYVGWCNRIIGGNDNGIILENPLTMGNRVLGNEIDGSDGIGIILRNGTTANEIHGNSITRCGTNAMVIARQASSNWIHHNYMEARAISPPLSTALLAVDSAFGNLINDCVLRGMGSDYGVIVSGSPVTYLIGLDIAKFRRGGVTLSMQSTASYVLDTRIHAGGGISPGQGILVTDSDRAVLERNQLEEITDFAINLETIDSPIVKLNQVLNSVSVGIRVANNTVRAHISENTIQGASGSTGIVIENVTDSTVERNTITGCNRAISDSSIRTRILSNEIQGLGRTGSRGLLLNGALDTLIENNKIEGCEIGVQGLHQGGVVLNANDILGCSIFGVNLTGVQVATLLTNNLFYGNNRGVKFDTFDPFSLMVNNTLVWNEIAHEGGGTAWNCIYWDNRLGDVINARQAAFSYCNFEQSPPAGTGNVSLNPLFVSSQPYSQSLHSDFHLRTQPPVPSPLIDRGSSQAPGLPLKDCHGNSRVQGAAPDIGMHEGG